MRNRWQLAPAPAMVRGHEGNRRLHLRWESFQGRRKKDTIAAVAIARELAGWAWSLAVMDIDENPPVGAAVRRAA